MAYPSFFLFFFYSFSSNRNQKVLLEVNHVNGWAQREWAELQQLNGSLHQSDLRQDLHQRQVSPRRENRWACTRPLVTATARISPMERILTPIRKEEGGASEEGVVATVGVAGSEDLGGTVTNSYLTRHFTFSTHPTPRLCHTLIILTHLPQAHVC